MTKKTEIETGLLQQAKNLRRDLQAYVAILQGEGDRDRTLIIDDAYGNAVQIVERLQMKLYDDSDALPYRL